MSVPAATARYVIAADDRSGPALKSILKGFKEIDKSARDVGKTLNQAAGLFLGIQLVQGLRKVIDATAQSTQGSKEFAIALGEVRSAANDLLATKSGLAEATANFESLRDILRDPSVVAAADAITSTLVKGFTATAAAVAQTVAGLRELGVQKGYFAPIGDQEMIDRNEKVIRDLEARRDQLQRAPQGRILRGDYAFDTAASRNQIEQLTAEIARRQAENEFLQTIGSVQIDVPDLKLPRIYSKEEIENLEDAEKAFKAHLNDKITDAGGLLSIDPRRLEESRADYEGFLKDLAESTNDSFEDISKNVDGYFKDWTVFADQAARGTYDAFSEFFFDPFENGIKGLGRSLIDTFRRALANKAAQQLLEYFSSFGAKGANAGKGGLIGDILGAVFGAYGGGKAAGGPLEQGKWYTAGEHGAEPIWGGGPGAFAMGYGGGGSGVTFAPVYNIDARGATQDAIAALPAVLSQNNQRLKQEIISDIQRRKIQIPR